VEKNKLDSLLKLASDEERYQLKVYYNAAIKMLKEYQMESTSVKLKDYQAANTALEDFAGRVQERYAPETRTFPNRRAVWKWLQETGWQVAQRTVYKHVAAGRLLPNNEGVFTLKAVKKYAQTFLKRADTGKRVQDEQDELQRRKTQLEVEKLEEEVARSKHKREVEEGAYIPRDQLEIELASRAAVLDAGIAHFFQSEAGAWIHLAGGDQRKLPELISVLMAAKDGFMNRYATTKEFVVEISGEENEEG